MEIQDLEKILLSSGSLTVGAYLTAVRGKINSSKIQNRLHYVFYAVCVLVALLGLYSVYAFWSQIAKLNWFFITCVILCLLASYLLFKFTFNNASKTQQYKTRDLDPIVNRFTIDADTDNIILIAGDLNFFGQTPEDMSANSQYQCLLKAGFRNIQILCFEPNTDAERRRYGKVINDFERVEIKFYSPENADLRIRGRMKTLRNVTHLLIYKKIKAGTYEALEWDTANENGALYTNLWTLLWSIARVPTEEQLQEYRRLLIN
ncbi:hypothetical protein CAP35_01365 [Chitinophagaceae bacterium IBVUCB1]|nr:hypothetical protein CAP35_01365 [Chitinophagaceae bacterium IBVUCB1]